MALGQRFPQFVLRIVGRSPSNYAEELQEFCYKVWRYTQGIPGGFLSTAATAIQAGISAAAGTVTASWAAADHVHSIETATPSNPTGVEAAEGSGTALMRADATVQDIILATAADQPDHYVLQSNSGEALGVEWVPGFTRSETEFLREIFVASLASEERGARRTAAVCDGRFASDRRAPCDNCCTNDRGVR